MFDDMDSYAESEIQYDLNDGDGLSEINRHVEIDINLPKEFVLKQIQVVKAPEPYMEGDVYLDPIKHAIRKYTSNGDYVRADAWVCWLDSVSTVTVLLEDGSLDVFDSTLNRVKSGDSSKISSAGAVAGLLVGGVSGAVVGAGLGAALNSSRKDQVVSFLANGVDEFVVKCDSSLLQYLQLRESYPSKIQSSEPAKVHYIFRSGGIDPWYESRALIGLAILFFPFVLIQVFHHSKKRSKDTKQMCGVIGYLCIVAVPGFFIKSLLAKYGYI